MTANVREANINTSRGLSKKALIARAKKLNIAGRWDMTKEQLAKEVTLIEIQKSIQEDLSRQLAPKVVEDPRRELTETKKRGRQEKVWEVVASDLCTTESLPKQATVIANSLTKGQKLTISQITKLAVENGLETKQDPIRIVRYYLPILKRDGMIVEI